MRSTHSCRDSIRSAAGLGLCEDDSKYLARDTGDNPGRRQRANFKVEPGHRQLGMFTAPHGLAFASNGDFYVLDWNQTGWAAKLRKNSPK